MQYPWIRITLLSCWLFGGFYLLTFFVTAMSYSLIWRIPADMSRDVSWIFYGVLFSVLPYVPMGGLLYSYLGRRPLILTVHAAGVGFLVEKGIGVFLAAMMASGFPSSWYGQDYPGSGHALLCEELPMYCSVFVESYYLWGTAASLVSVYAGTLICRSLRTTSMKKEKDAS
ncbi:hypothetical protein MF069_11345 [Paenibacillus mucilaginosus]|nr:hypothetical protein [Paenibacillus mucilaginosus]WDM29440.1 hypothetical protein KCX80_09900 [Paenibacillus mucilaginosus]